MQTRELTPELFRPVEESRDEERIAGPPIGFWKDSWGRLKKNRGALASFGVLALIVAVAIIGPLLTGFSPNDQDIARQYTEPFAGAHWFGTDEFGRDVWARVWSGTQVSLMVAVLAALIDLFVGVIYGAASGYFGGRVDEVMQRILEILYGIPYLVIVILAMLVLGAGFTSLVIALAITGWVPMARVVRGKVLQLKEQEFFLASRSLGAGGKRLIGRHLIPNSLGAIIVNLMFTIASAIFFESFLSFIGLGIQPPEASLGSLISENYTQINYYPYLLWFPLAIFAAIMVSLNLFADGLRDAFDPRMRR